jgi:hypothetical protein
MNTVRNIVLATAVAEQYPPWCLRNMMACGFRYDPGTGTWQPGG